MATVTIVVTVLFALYMAASAAADFARYKQVSLVMAKAGVPESWMPLLGVLKAAGAVGLLVGLGVPLIGTAAAIGVVVYFVGAIVTHVRVRLYGVWIVYPVFALLLAVATLGLGLADLDVFGRNCDLILRACAS